MVIDRDDLPADPDLDSVPEELLLMAYTNHGQVTVLSEDGVSRDTLVIVPGLFGHARRMAEGWTEEED